jgi:predicted RND superfamily exporter protein
VVCFALAVGSLPSLKTELRLYDLNDQAFPTTKTLREVKDKFGEANTLFAIFPDAAGSPASFCKTTKFLHDERNENSEITEIIEPLQIRKAAEKGDRLWFPPLLSAECAEWATPQLTNPRAELVKLDATPWAGILSDKTGGDLSALVHFRDTEGGSRFGNFDPKPVGEFIAHAKESGVNLLATGPAAFEWYFNQVMGKDALVNGLMIVFFLLFFRVFYGTWRSGFYFSLTLFITVIFVYGAMALVGAPLDLLNNNLFLMSAVAGAEDFVFVSEAMFSPVADENPFRTLALPGFFTTLTTLVGFLSLGVSNLEIIRRFGYCAAWAAFVEWAVLFHLIPGLFSLGTAAKNKQQPIQWTLPAKAWRPSFLKKCAEFTPPRFIIPIALLLFLIGGMSYRFLNYNDSPAHNFPATHPYTKAFDYLRKNRGWEGTIDLYLRAPPSGKPDLGKIDEIVSKLKEDENVKSIQNPADLNRFLTADVGENLRSFVIREASQTDDYQSVFASDGSARATVFLKSLDLKPMGKTFDRIRKLCESEGCEPVGENVVYLEYSRTVISTLVESLGLSLFLVGIVLLFLCGKRKAMEKAKILFTAFFGPVVMLAVMAATRTQVSLITCMFEAISVGIAGDNAVQYLFAAKSKPTLAQGISMRGMASLLLGLLLIFVFSSFLGLTLLPMKTLGLLFMAGFGLTLFGDFFLLKALVKTPANPK